MVGSYISFTMSMMSVLLSFMHNNSITFWHTMIIQWWFVNLGSHSPEISLVRIKSVGTNFHVRTNWPFSNPENSLIRKDRPGTNVSGLTNHHCTSHRFVVCIEDLRHFSDISAISRLESRRLPISEIVAVRLGIEPCTSYFASQELNRYTTSAPHTLVEHSLNSTQIDF